LEREFLEKEMDKKIDWIDPIIIAKNIANHHSFSENFIFLYSALNLEYKKSTSYISFDLKDKILANNFDQIEQKILQNPEENYFGYLSYELKNEIEDFKKINKNYLKIPKLYFANFHFNLIFDHDKKEIICRFPDHLEEKFQDSIQNIIANNNFDPQKLKISKLDNNFSDSEYLDKIQQIQNKIAKGDFYQANLTRKFFGKCQKKDDYFDIFHHLMQISPGNYSAFLKFEDLNIISSSPELFLDINHWQVKSAPIKGTSPRSEDKIEDRKNLEYLKNSNKEKAENLMIVDLVRNDLSRNCQPNSVRTKNLFKISSFKKIHHMVSEIIGKKSPDKNNIDIIKGCFPPGSMTGAPKIKAMEICDELEQIERGIYSGAIGLINYNICKLSVVIRTLIIDDDKFEFQSGGAITFDSNPQMELQESKDKNKGIENLLEI
jgi:para-aminobenzoate synthetase component 1